MSSSRWMVVMFCMQAMILLGQWVGQPSVPVAQAQIPDAGAQRNQIIDGIKSTNDKLDHLISLLESGGMTVRTVAPSTERSR